MTQEEKNLLLKDLCARLPYNCMVSIAEGGIDGIQWADLTLNSYLFYQIMEEDALEYVKPYLRPISDMTPKECERLFEILHIDEDRGDWLKINDIGIIRLITENGKDFYEIAEAIDYLNSIHIDYRNMIEDGLAYKATDGMYKKLENMTPEEIIGRIREEIDKINFKYEGHPLIEEEDIMGGFEDIINDYYEEKSPF